MCCNIIITNLYTVCIYTVCSSYIIWFAQIVDFYLFLIAEECNKKLENRVYCVSTFFLYKLLLGCSEVESWIKVIDKIGS